MKVSIHKEVTMTVAFIGHREVENRETLKKTVKKTVEKLIVNENADTFLFGSMSDFNNLCYEAVTELKKRYRNIERIFVRADFEHISKEYTD